MLSHTPIALNRPPSPIDDRVNANENETAESHMMAVLRQFFSDDANWQMVKEVMENKSRGESLSRRMIDYFMTTYSKRHDVRIPVVNRYGEVVEFRVHQEYLGQLRTFHKDEMDPFCRGPTCMRFRGLEIAPKQLVFYRWFIMNGLMRYAQQHCREIYEEMNGENKKGRRLGDGEKRARKAAAVKEKRSVKPRLQSPIKKSRVENTSTTASSPSRQ